MSAGFWLISSIFRDVEKPEVLVPSLGPRRRLGLPAFDSVSLGSWIRLVCSMSDPTSKQRGKGTLKERAIPALLGSEWLEVFMGLYGS